MSKARISASAIVTLTIEIEAYSSWGEGCSIDQVHRQASREVSNRVERALKDGKCGRVRLIGEPQVRSVIAKEAAP